MKSYQITSELCNGSINSIEAHQENLRTKKKIKWDETINTKQTHNKTNVNSTKRLAAFCEYFYSIVLQYNQKKKNNKSIYIKKIMFIAIEHLITNNQLYKIVLYNYWVLNLNENQICLHFKL